MKPEHVTARPGILFFVHGGVWIVGNFENHKRLLRDLVIGSGQVGVFVEYTPLLLRSIRRSSTRAMPR
jgi:acetyl esterase/lipase